MRHSMTAPWGGFRERNSTWLVPRADRQSTDPLTGIFREIVVVGGDSPGHRTSAGMNVTQGPFHGI